MASQAHPAPRDAELVTLGLKRCSDSPHSACASRQPLRVFLICPHRLNKRCARDRSRRSSRISLRAPRGAPTCVVPPSARRADARLRAVGTRVALRFSTAPAPVAPCRAAALRAPRPARVLLVLAPPTLAPSRSLSRTTTHIEPARRPPQLLPLPRGKPRRQLLQAAAVIESSTTPLNPARPRTPQTTIAGVAARVLQRILALTAAICTTTESKPSCDH